MTEEIRIKSAFASNEERINYALELRKDLIRTEPITHQRITKLDNWLIAQPNLPIGVVVQIYTRLMWVSACDYEREKDPLVKHLRLLVLREMYQDFREAPERVQEALRPFWLDWLDVLNTEEQKLERANGAA